VVAVSLFDDDNRPHIFILDINLTLFFSTRYAAH
jgi:hypothetical protein